MQYFIAFMFGASWGSFFMCARSRIRYRLSLWGRSVCPSCGNVLVWYHLVPVFSYIFLLGRCAYCRSRISLLDFLGELLFGLAFSLVIHLMVH